MNKTTKMVIVLTVITGLSGAILSSWDSVTKPKIEYHKLQALKVAISDVLPSYDYYEEKDIDGKTIYIGKLNDSTQPTGIAFKVDGSGFQGNLSIMVGVDPSFTSITGIKVLEQIETPGLGTKIVEDPSNKTDPFWFPEQFVGVIFSPQINVVKNSIPQNSNEIQAISGATISSKAVVRILNEDISIMKELYQSVN
ncbi:FMN-binding protein [bacterium]|nr:FMN-binding protein [bacterium]